MPQCLSEMWLVSLRLTSRIWHLLSVALKAIRKLKPNLSAGPDGYPPILVRKLANVFAGPLALVYNSFMSVGQVPDVWRCAIVTLVYKNGAACDVSNYRPISLTCVFCKVMERVIVSEISDYLWQKGLINKHQHGLLSRRSTTTNLIETFNDWTLAINDKVSIMAAYIDYIAKHLMSYVTINCYISLLPMQLLVTCWAGLVTSYGGHLRLHKLVDPTLT